MFRSSRRILLRGVVRNMAGERTFNNRFESVKKEFLKDPLKNMAALLGTLVLMGDAYSRLKLFGSDAFTLLRALENFKAASRDEIHYIDRPAEESRIVAETNSNVGGSYCVVYGPRGAGKSEIVDHLAMGKKGVVKLVVGRADSSNDVLASLSTKLLGRVQSGLNTEALQAAVSKSKKPKSKSGTIIFEVERAADPTTLPSVRSLAKALGASCHCIIVLSEASAVLEFGKDTAREEFIYVGEMTHQEAKKLVQKLLEINKFSELFQFSDRDLEYVFDEIGTNPATLEKMVKKVVEFKMMTVKQFVVEELRDAEEQLLAFPHQQILQALKEHPEGVSPGYFKKQENKGVDLSDPKAVGAAMKDSNAIVYRMELGQYQLISTAHRKALESYNPILPNQPRDPIPPRQPDNPIPPGPDDPIPPRSWWQYLTTPSNGTDRSP